MYKLSILIHGKETDKEAVNAMNLVLQEQLNELQATIGVNDIEAFFFLHPDKTELKRKKACLANTYGEFYTQIQAPFQIQRTYLTELWYYLNEHEKDEAKLAERKIYKRKPWQVNKNLPVLEDVPEQIIEDHGEKKDVTDENPNIN